MADKSKESPKDKDSVTYPWEGISNSIWNFNDHNKQKNPKVEDVVQDPARDNTTTLSNASSGLGLSGSYVISNGTSGNVYVGGTTIGGGGGGYGNITLSNNTWANTTTTTTPTHGDMTINGKSLKDFMEKVEQRLAILTPDIEKLEHFQALREAYEHYKTLEALCIMPKKDDNSK
jgi:hypothetical protein